MEGSGGSFSNGLPGVRGPEGVQVSVTLCFQQCGIVNVNSLLE